MNKKVRLALIVSLVIVLTGVVVFSSNLGILQAETKDKAEMFVGYVDVMEVFETHPNTEVAKEELNTKAQELQQQLEIELKDKSQEDRKKVIEDYQNLLAQREYELANEVIASIDEAIREVADEIGVKVVLDKKNVIYGGQDLTEKVKVRIAQKAVSN